MYKIRDYHSRHQVAYDPTDVLIESILMLPNTDRSPKHKTVWHSIPIAQCLIGTKWDALALAYLSAFNPVSIRVARDEVTCDSVTGRITVHVDETDRIISISQECRFHVSQTIDVKHGHDLMQQIEKKVQARE